MGESFTVDGATLHGPIDRGGLFDGDKKTARENKKLMKTAIDNEIERIRDTDQMSDHQKDMWIDRLKDGKQGLDKPKGKIAKRYNEALETWTTAKSQRQLAEQAAKADGGVKVDKTLQGDVKKTPKCPSPSETEEAKSSDGAAESSKSGGEDVSKAYENFEVEEFANTMMEDPQAAMDQLDDMSFKEKQMALQEAQMYMQQIQRMAKLQSNLASMAHKTSSAVIGNIR